jgi:hypothetical protein
VGIIVGQTQKYYRNSVGTWISPPANNHNGYLISIAGGVAGGILPLPDLDILPLPDLSLYPSPFNPTYLKV